MSVQEQYKKKYDEKISKLMDVEKFKKDEMIKFIFDVGSSLFKEPIDTKSQDWLINHGGKLVGAYSYLGVKASEERAKRDIADQCLEEIEKLITINNSNKEMTITEARTRAKFEVAILKDDVIQQEQIKNNYEHIVSATDKMISFIQTSLKMIDRERYVKRDMHDSN